MAILFNQFAAFKDQIATIFKTLGGHERVISHPMVMDWLEALGHIAEWLQQLSTKIDALENTGDMILLSIPKFANLGTKLAAIKEAIVGLNTLREMVTFVKNAMA